MVRENVDVTLDCGMDQTKGNAMHRITIWTGLAGISICCVAAVGGFGPSSGEIGGLIASAVWAEARAQTPADASEAHESIRIPRHPAPSPDGGEIAFSYQGDIWIVPVAGGEARRLTANPAYEAYPIWSPDGRWIAFSSDRAGNDDIYVLPVAGGELRRLTWNSYQDLPTGWTPDSRAVLFRSWRFVLNGDNPGMFCVSLEGGLPFTILPVGGHDAALSPDGRTLAFAQGGGPWWRRNYQGSARYRLWLAELEEPLGDAGGRLQSSRKLSQVSMAGQTAANLTMQAVGALRTASRYLNLTELNAVTQDPDRKPTDFWAAWEEGAPEWSRPEFETGVNRAPAWLPGGEHLLYLSEDEGVCNLKIVSTRTGRRDWVTRLDHGRLRFPALSRNGRLAAFEYEDGVYTVRLPDALPPHESGDWDARIAAPQRLEIRIPYDLKADPLEWVKVDSGAEEMKLSPDGKQIAFVCRGEVFAMKASEKEPFAYNISQSPARDGQIDWAPDSKSLVFVSEREGNPDIYIARSADEADARLARAVHIEIEPLVRGDEEQSQPHHSPDGKRIAFVRGRGTLMVMDADGSNQREVLRHPREIDFSWSPDSKCIVLARADDDFNSDIWIVP
ncbi:MAG: DPP IV N-terminal domain-containing protein, partial [Candidatus Eisenbacteria bacterium]